MLYKALYSPGTKVTSVKDPKCTYINPNSIMYFSHIIRCIDPSASLVQCRVVLVKRGKTGRARLDYLSVMLPLIWINDTILQKAVENQAHHSGNDFSAVIIEPMNEGNFNLLTVPAPDFLAFVLSKVMFLNHLCKNFTHYNFWPKDPNFTLNIFRDVLARNGGDDLALHVETLATVEKRSKILAVLRFLEALLQPAATRYHSTYKGYYTNYIENFIKPVVLAAYKKRPDYYKELQQLTN